MIELKGLDRAKATVVVTVDVNVGKLDVDSVQKARKDQKSARNLLCPLLPSDLSSKVVDVWNVRDTARNWCAAHVRIPDNALEDFLKYSGADEVW
eukprot:6031309-Amphidinium_carterae.1